MSFGGSHWCRSTPDLEHRSTYTSPNRSAGTPEHRSTTPTESTASCNVVEILTHEEFAAKHPHPPSPLNEDRILPIVKEEHNVTRARVALGTGCKAWCVDAEGRVSVGTGRGRGVNFVTLVGSSLTHHVALSVLGWTRVVCSLIGTLRDENLKVEGVRDPNPKRKRRDRFRELGCGMDWRDGGKQDFVGKGLHQESGRRMVGVIRNEHRQVRIMGNQSVIAEQQ
ncbi:hypothetical protein DY000_02014306 [Brassica cretica]|uniref:Uncharacterized protein n=1 Tax=Brassica cretica TaxID=69181 RepID=A0ABQ7CQ24_BRACR|nr:hypothetical protein DY000_02014306 [Brassica cretica]